MHIRTATPQEIPAVCNVLDGGLLAVSHPVLERSVEDDAVYVAVTEKQSEPGEETVIGALVLDGREIVAVAVRPRRRGQGIGTALVETALTRRGVACAEFDERVRPFWDALGFSIEPMEDEDRYRGKAQDISRSETR